MAAQEGGLVRGTLDVPDMLVSKPLSRGSPHGRAQLRTEVTSCRRYAQAVRREQAPVSPAAA